MSRSASFVAAGLALAAALRAQAPANDAPSGAIALAVGVNPASFSAWFTNVGATADPSIGQSGCFGSANSGDVWFSYTAPSSGDHLIQACTPPGYAPGTSEVVLTVFSAGLSMLACQSISCTAGTVPSSSFSGAVWFSAAAGSSVLIRATRAFTSSPDGLFRLSAGPNLGRLCGETCATALAMSEERAIADLNGAAAEGVGPSGCAMFSATTPDVWAAYTASTTGTAVVARDGSAPCFMAAYTACSGGAALACDNAAGDGLLSFPVTAGTTYYVRFGLQSSQSNPFDKRYPFSISVPPSVVNDTCATATAISPGVQHFSLSGAVPDASAGFNCPPVADDPYEFLSTHDGWTTFTTPAPSVIELSVYGMGFLRGSLFEGVCGALVPLECNDRLTYADFVGGRTFFFRTGPLHPDDRSWITVDFRLTAIPPNAACAGSAAAPLALGANGPYAFAGAVTSTPAGCLDGGPDLWHSFVADRSGRVAISGCGTVGPVSYAVFGPCGGPAIHCDATDLQNLGPCATSQPDAAYLEFDATAGVAYRLRVARRGAGAIVYAVDLSYRTSFRISGDVPSGAVVVETAFGVPGQTVLNAATFHAGAFPSGWWFGLDIPFGELLLEVSSGPPFFATADAAGSYAASFGVPALPLGVTLYAVAIGFDANGAVTHVVPPAAFAL
jgi:hypothetical protein